MRSERRALGVAVTILALGLASGCREPAPSSATEVTGRFAGVRKQRASPELAGSAFCEKSYPAGGDGARRYVAPPERPLPSSTDREGSGGTRGGGWTWVNLWATWCGPCVEEMELLRRWHDGFSREGLQVGFELVSIDEDAERERDLVAWRAKGLPGPIRWLRSERDLGPFLDALGVARDAAIPVHALVDAAGWVRCVRVGAVHEQDYAMVKALLGG